MCESVHSQSFLHPGQRRLHLYLPPSCANGLFPHTGCSFLSRDAFLFSLTVDKANFSFLISLQVIQRAIPPLPQPTTQTCIQPAAPATPQVKIYVWRRDWACRTMQEDLTFAAQCAKPNGFHVLASKRFPGKAPALSSS